MYFTIQSTMPANIASPVGRMRLTLQTAPLRPPPPRFRILEMFGILLGITTIGVELGTGMSAEYYFDPLPTPAHILLAMFVPAANFWLWWALRRSPIASPATLATANAAAIGIASFYTL